MTPWQLQVYVQAAGENENESLKRELWLLWHAEVFRRMKKLPSLKELLDKPADKKPGIDESDIKARLRKYQEKRGK